MEHKKLKPLELVSFLATVTIVTIVLIVLGLTQFGAWKFDATVIGSFLFGDYVLRWLLRRREVKSSSQLKVPEVFRLALGYGWFFVFVLLAGELAFSAALITKIFYGGQISHPLVGLVSIALGLALALDYLTNYRQGIKANEPSSH